MKKKIFNKRLDLNKKKISKISTIIGGLPPYSDRGGCDTSDSDPPTDGDDTPYTSRNQYGVLPTYCHSY